jgi:V8-like Glu-specific endopeptidase
MNKQNEMPNPLLVEEWSSKIKTSKAKKLDIDVKIKFLDLPIPKTMQGIMNYRVNVEKDKLSFNFLTKTIGQHNFRPDIKATILSEKIKIDFNEKHFDGFRPNHLNLSVAPKTLEKEFSRRYWTPKFKENMEGLASPSTVFSPDTRYNFNDTAFPWCTCGKVETAGGYGSGVMIGPRHLLTASHVIDWGPNNTAGSVKFTPSYFDGSSPFGVAYATEIYSFKKVDGSDLIDLEENAFDYVVCVLDTRLGELTGWMGATDYTTNWNGKEYWSHIGYPSDMSGGQRPAFIGSGSIESADNGSVGGRTGFRMVHKVDVIPGQSGGPYFGWWDNEPWPRVVGIQSGENLGGVGGKNTSGGGNPLTELIVFAKNNKP